MPPVSGATNFRYSPVRFVRNQKVSRFDKLMLVFNALALNLFSSNPAGSGKLIYGSQYNTVTVPLAKLLEPDPKAYVRLIIDNHRLLSEPTTAAQPCWRGTAPHAPYPTLAQLNL